MNHPLTLNLSEELYRALQHVADGRGQTVEATAAYLLDVIVDEVQGDPVLRLCGSITSEVTDVAERHDHYIGEALYAEMKAVDHG